MKFSILLNIVLAVAVIVLFLLWRGQSSLSFAGFHGSKDELVAAATQWQRLTLLSEDFDKKRETATLAVVKANRDKWTGHPVEPFSDTALTKEYIRNFLADSDALKPLQDPKNKDSFTRSIWFPRNILAKWIGFVMDNDCDGMRMYFSKYSVYAKPGAPNGTYDGDRDVDEDRGQLDHRYGVIFSMTKANGDKSVDTFIKQQVLLPTPNGQVAAIRFDGVYNYSNLCPPNNCPFVSFESRTW